MTRVGDTPDSNSSVQVLVSASQKSDCASGSMLSMKVDDLQEMHNHFREQLDSGLKTLADNQGKNGLPKAPDTKTVANPDGQVKPDTSVKDELAAQQSDADKAQADVQQRYARPAARISGDDRQQIERRARRCREPVIELEASAVNAAGASGSAPENCSRDLPARNSTTNTQA